MNEGCLLGRLGSGFGEGGIWGEGWRVRVEWRLGGVMKRTKRRELWERHQERQELLCSLCALQ